MQKQTMSKRTSYAEWGWHVTFWQSSATLNSIKTAQWLLNSHHNSTEALSPVSSEIQHSKLNLVFLFLIQESWKLSHSSYAEFFLFNREGFWRS